MGRGRSFSADRNDWKRYCHSPKMKNHKMCSHVTVTLSDVFL